MPDRGEPDFRLARGVLGFFLSLLSLDSSSPLDAVFVFELINHRCRLCEPLLGVLQHGQDVHPRGESFCASLSRALRSLDVKLYRNGVNAVAKMESEAAERAITTDKEAAEEADANCPVCGVAWSEPNAQESTLGPQCARCGKKINGPLPENKLPTPPLQTSPNLFSRLFAAGKQQSPKTSHAQADPPQKQITEQTNEAQLAEALAGVSQVPTNKLHYFHCSAGAVPFC